MIFTLKVIVFSVVMSNAGIVSESIESIPLYHYKKVGASVSAVFRDSESFYRIVLMNKDKELLIRTKKSKGIYDDSAIKAICYKKLSNTKYLVTVIFSEEYPELEAFNGLLTVNQFNVFSDDFGRYIN